MKKFHIHEFLSSSQLPCEVDMKGNIYYYLSANKQKRWSNLPKVWLVFAAVWGNTWTEIPDVNSTQKFWNLKFSTHLYY